MKHEDGSQIGDGDDAYTIADLQAKLQATKAELETAKIQRDYILRLLRQQQTLRTAGNQNSGFAFYMEQNSPLAALLSRAPRKLKDALPVRLKQFIKNFVINHG